MLAPNKSSIVTALVLGRDRPCVYRTLYPSKVCAPSLLSLANTLSLMSVVLPRHRVRIVLASRIDGPGPANDSVFDRMDREEDVFCSLCYLNERRSRRARSTLYPYASAYLGVLYGSRLLSHSPTLRIPVLYPPPLTFLVLCLLGHQEIAGPSGPRGDRRALLSTFLGVWLTLLRRWLRARLAQLYNPTGGERQRVRDLQGLLHAARDGKVELAAVSRVTRETLRRKEAFRSLPIRLLPYSTAQALAPALNQRRLAVFLDLTSARILQRSHCHLSSTPLRGLGSNYVTAYSSLKRSELPNFGEARRMVVWREMGRNRDRLAPHVACGGKGRAEALALGQVLGAFSSLALLVFAALILFFELMPFCKRFELSLRF